MMAKKLCVNFSFFSRTRNKSYAQVSKRHNSNSTFDSSSVEELRIPVPWGHLAAKVWGPENGTPIIAIHGQMDNAGSFDTLAPLLAPLPARIVCFDCADHGLSSHTPLGHVSNDTFSQLYQIHHVMSYLGWEKASFIGHSQGVMAAMFWSAVRPTMVDRLINLDIIKAPRFIEEEFATRIDQCFTGLLQASHKITHPILKGMTYHEARYKMLNAYKGRGLTEKTADILLKRGLKRIKEGQDLFEFSWDPRAAVRQHILTDGQMGSIIRAIRCPLLLIRADEGLRWPHENIEVDRYYIDNFYGRNENFRIVQVPGQHHVHLSHPELVAPHILQFLTDEIIQEKVQVN